MANSELRLVQRSLSLLLRAEVLLAALSLILLLLLSLGQILARNLFDTGLPMVDVTIRHLVLYVTFFGAVVALNTGSHIKIDVINAWLSERWLDRLYRPLFLVGTVVCGVLSVAAARFWLDEWTYATSDEHMEVLFNLILPLGFSLLTLHFSIGLVTGPPRDEAL